MNRLLMFFVLVVCSFNVAAEQKAFELPDGSSVAKALYVLCDAQAKTAGFAAGFRDRGMKLEQMLARIPSDGVNRFTSDMKKAVQAAFAFPEISPTVMYFWTHNICAVAIYDGIPLPSFSTSRDAVLGCQKKHGSNDSQELLDCIRSVFF